MNNYQIAVIGLLIGIAIFVVLTAGKVGVF